MGKVMVNETSLQDIADAIREKTEGTETYKPSEMGAAIRALKNGIDPADAPKIEYDGKWSGWTLEIYDGVLYWEALFSTSGAMFNYAVERVCDAWGIGGGGAGGTWYRSGSTCGSGGGSGFTNMVEGITIPTGSIAVTIGAGGTTFSGSGVDNTNTDRIGANGGSTTFLTFSASGGGGSYKSGGAGGSNGGTSTGTNSSSFNPGGENGTPGSGKIMSKFWSEEHNTEYGAGGAKGASSSGISGGGGGYMDVGVPDSSDGHGYGAGGAGKGGKGNSGCLIIRIPVE